MLEVRGLAAQPGAVIHELAIDLAGRVVDHRHTARVLSAEEFVNFVFRPLEQAFLGRRGPRADALEHGLEYAVQVLHRPLALQLHQAERGALVEQHHQDDALRDIGEEHGLLFALMHQRGELVLPDHLGELVVGAEVGGGERGEGVGVELGRFTHRRHELAGAIHQQRAAGVRVAQERLEVLLDLLEVVLRERPTRGTRHHPPSVLSDSVMSRRASSACAIVTPSAYSRSPPTGMPRAIRVTRTPVGLSSCCRYVAVTSPSMEGLVAMMTSVTRAAAPPPLVTRATSRSSPSASGPTPSSGDSRPPST